MQDKIIAALKAYYRGRRWHGDRWAAVKASPIFISPEAKADLQNWGANLESYSEKRYV